MTFPSVIAVLLVASTAGMLNLQIKKVKGPMLQKVRFLQCLLRQVRDDRYIFEAKK